ncbi:MAG: hypothetical protein ACTSXX_10080 [Candidatus Baldrarchaeia archaeon]
MEYAPPCRNLFLRKIHNLNHLLNRTSSDIRETLNTRIFPPKNLKITLEPRKSIARGSYSPKRKLITLYNDDWCRKTLIHETLHAISAFSQIPKLYNIYDHERDFVEGLTEFLTGYVLFKKHKNCYEEWIEGRYPVCSISYENFVRLFGAVAQILTPISDLVKLYVYNPNVDWYAEYRRFLNNHNLEDFLLRRPANKRIVTSHTLFKHAIETAIRKKLGEETLNEFRDLLYEAP